MLLKWSECRGAAEEVREMEVGVRACRVSFGFFSPSNIGPLRGFEQRSDMI